MNDRELLEMAAKAAGIPKRIVAAEPGLYALYQETDGIDACMRQWNPLTDDGDALRLACKVGLRINTAYKTGKDERPGIGVWLPGDTEHYPPFWTAHAKDHCAAVRQTIVRAAAEIGRAMQ